MSNNAISRIDSKIIGEMDVVSYEEAERALIGADMMPEESMLTRVRDRAKIGRFIASEVGGYVVATSEFYLVLLEKAARSLEKDCSGGTAISRANAAEALKNIANVAAVHELAQLKGAELVAFGKQKKKKQDNAPINIRGTAVFATNAQMNNSAPPTPEIKAA